MSDYPTLKNAPIQEALIDLRAIFESPPDESAFEGIIEELRERYPDNSPIQKFTTHIQIGDAGQSQRSTTQHRGVLLQSVDKSFVFQAQVDGFTLSKLRPYTKWDDLLEEAKRLWAIYEKHTNPLTVNRVAVRFVNCFDLPEPISNLKDFFEAPPELPPKLPQHLSNYLVRYQIPDTETGATVLLTQSMDEVASNQKQFIIDIDAFRATEFDVKKQQWWQLLTQLRSLKNRVFYSSLTPRTLDLFK